MKISLVFGLAQQPIAKLWIKYGTVSKRSCSSRRTQTWNTRRTRTPCKTSRPFETHKSGSQSHWRAGMITDLTTGQITGHQRKLRLPVARVLGASEKPKPRAGTRDAGAKQIRYRLTIYTTGTYHRLLVEHIFAVTTTCSFYSRLSIRVLPARLVGCITDTRRLNLTLPLNH
jgi:hypothetical protein